MRSVGAASKIVTPLPGAFLIVARASATMDVSPDGEFLYVVNFNLHGDMIPSSVSVVATSQMLEVKRIQTCIMPHGSRFNPQGTKHYSACMMNDALVDDPGRD